MITQEPIESLPFRYKASEFLIMSQVPLPPSHLLVEGEMTKRVWIPKERFREEC